METFYLYDNSQQLLKEVLTEDETNLLPTFYDYLECELIDMPYFDKGIYIVCDDMGLLKQPQNINFVYDENQTKHTFVGKMMFVSIDSDGATIGLDETQVAYMKEKVTIKTLPIEEVLH